MANTVISDKCMEFSILGVKTAKRLKALHEFEFASQLLRSSTSVGANVSEANYAQSARTSSPRCRLRSKSAMKLCIG